MSGSYTILSKKNTVIRKRSDMSMNRTLLRHRQGVAYVLGEASFPLCCMEQTEHLSRVLANMEQRESGGLFY